MATNLVVNGVSYAYPNTGDQQWGSAASGWALAVTNGMLQKAGGSFTLTADVNFGATYGLLSAYFSTRTALPSTAGLVRLAKTESIGWRNNANNGNNLLSTDTSDNLTYNGVILASSAGGVPVASGGTGISSYTAGDMLYASGATTLSKLAIGAVNRVAVSTGSAPSWALLVNANIDPAAAIAYSKLALTGSILNADLAGSIAYSKLSLTGAILNADLAGSIAASKLVATDIATVGTITTGTWSATTIAVNKGGTGITSGTSGGILGYTASGTLASSALLAQYGVMLGGGAGATPATLAPSASTVFALISGGASANPAWGLLTPAGGGTGVANNAASTLTISGNFGTTLTVTGTTSVTLPTSGTLATTFASSQVLCDTPNGRGSTNTKIRRFTNSTTTGTDITYADSATLGATFTINTAGLYAISYWDGYSAGAGVIGISVNGDGTVNVDTIPAANRLGESVSQTGSLILASAVARLAATDVIRAHSNGNLDFTGAFAGFRIVRIG